jgi:hypothetical protein
MHPYEEFAPIDPLRKVLGDIDLECEASRLKHVGPVPDRLYHYTDANGLEGIVRTGKLWATHRKFLNDSSEIGYGYAVLAEEINKMLLKHQNSKVIQAFLLNSLKAVSESIETWDLYFTCFCEKDNLLNQWRSYASTGYALGFSTKHIETEILPRHAERAYILTRVIYDVDVQRSLLQELLEKTIDVLYKAYHRQTDEEGLHYVPGFVGFIRGMAMRYLAYFKHPAFEVEHEWRMSHLGGPAARAHINFRNGQFGLTPYVLLSPGPGPVREDGSRVLPLCGVTHAPTSDTGGVRTALRLLLQRYGYEVEISGSELPIRTR